MAKYIILGAGALGSHLSEELAKTAFAQEMPIQMLVLDLDKVEDRNIIAQNFRPEDLGKSKAEVVASLCNTYSPYVNCTPIVQKFTQENMFELIPPGEETIIINAFDNAQSRIAAWFYGNATGVPVVHPAMGQGYGYVTWSHKDYDKFPMSPKNSGDKYLKEIKEGKNEEKKLKACELNASRSLILNTVLAARNSIFLYDIGHDITGEFSKLQEELGGSLKGLFTYYETTTNGYTINMKMIGVE